MKPSKKVSPALTKRDIRELSAKISRNQKALDKLDGVSKKIDSVSAKIDRNQKALNQLDGVSKKIDDVSAKIDRNQKALDQIDDVARILRENEQNLKDLGGLKHRLDTLDKIMVTVDKMAGSMQTYQQEQALNSNTLSKHEDRLETIETHLNLPTTL